MSSSFTWFYGPHCSTGVSSHPNPQQENPVRRKKSGLKYKIRRREVSCIQNVNTVAEYTVGSKKL